MKHDPFYNQILSGLERQLDPDTFEACAVDLIKIDGLNAVPIPGGDDAGMDGAIADGEGEPFPLVTTTSPKCVGNLTRNLKQYVATGGKRRKAIFATSQPLTPKRRQNLHNRAGELGFTLIQVYEQSAIASGLYHNPIWCKTLLQLSGDPSALSIVPHTSRPLLNLELIGRDEVLQWLQNTKGHRLLVGEPGSGKTRLLYQLTQVGSALFVVDYDKTNIANAIREQKPKIIIVDDAFANENFLKTLKHLRIQIRADYEIIASCWNGDAESIADILNLSNTHIHKLKRLTQDQIVSVIASAGIRGIDWLVREIVRQSEGLPGLAVTLTYLCLIGDAHRIHTAEALNTTILDFYAKRVDASVRDILAAFALGGNAGMAKTVISRELQISPLYLKKTLHELAAGGVIAEVGYGTDRVKVRPPALRHALIKGAFFSGAAAFPDLILEALLENTPDYINTTIELINVKARGGNVSNYLLQTRLEKLPTVPSIWNNPLCHNG